MIRRAAVLLLALLLGGGQALAWDPEDDFGWWEEPVALEVTDWWEPAAQDVWWWQEPAWEPAPEPPPVPAVPAGLYLVTEVYAGDVVTVAGPVTTYATVTVQDSPGTYARVVDTVGTGSASAYDGAAFNGRAALDDGRSVAGTYYENFVLAGGAFVPVSIVFFQDDSAVAPVPTPVPAAPPATPAPLPSPTPAPRAPAPTPVPTAAPTAWVVPAAEPAPAATPAPTEPPRPPELRTGVARSSLGGPHSAIEVIRGRAIDLWIRATADGSPVAVTSWRVVGGEHTALGAVSGDGETPLRVRWDLVTAGTPWVLRLDVTALVAGMRRAADGEVTVTVRSPALIR